VWDGNWSRSRYAVIAVVGCCSLGAGPWRCSMIPSLGALSGLDLSPGPGSGSGVRTIPDADAGTGGERGRLPAPPLPTPPPPVPPPAKTPAPPAAPPIATAPRRDEPTTREPHGPAKAPPTRARIPDEVVMTAVRALQPTFVACWKRAQRSDPTLTSARVRISLEVDDAGAVTAARTDAEDAKLSRCLANVARKLTFPAPGRLAAFEIPLYF